MKKQAILMSNLTNRFFKVYSDSILTEIKKEVILHEELITSDLIHQKLDILQNAEVIFSTWGMPSFTSEEIKTYFPKLEIIFYAAGSVQSFAKAFIENGVKVVSSYAANAIPTAEFACCQIVLANKGYFQAAHRVKNRSYQDGGAFHNTFPGNYNIKIGILGAGMVGSHVIKLLKAMQINADIWVYDPFLSDERAKGLGVTKKSLEEIFSTCQTISNHIANNEHTQMMIHKKHFDLMLKNATFINTGRGQQIIEEDLINTLKLNPTITAVLDVTHPEPPKPDSELYQLDNVILTPHIAGSMGNELHRMSSYSVEELRRWLNNEPLKYNVTKKMLETMA